MCTNKICHNYRELVKQIYTKMKWSHVLITVTVPQPTENSPSNWWNGFLSLCVYPNHVELGCVQCIVVNSLAGPSCSCWTHHVASSSHDYCVLIAPFAAVFGFSQCFGDQGWFNHLTPQCCFMFLNGSKIGNFYSLIFRIHFFFDTQATPSIHTFSSALFYRPLLTDLFWTTPDVSIHIRHLLAPSWCFYPCFVLWHYLEYSGVFLLFTSFSHRSLFSQTFRTFILLHLTLSLSHVFHDFISLLYC